MTKNEILTARQSDHLDVCKSQQVYSSNTAKYTIGTGMNQKAPPVQSIQVQYVFFPFSNPVITKLHC